MRTIWIGSLIVLILSFASPLRADNVALKLPAHPPQAVILEAIHAAMMDSDVAIVGRLHNVDTEQQMGTVVSERELKGKDNNDGTFTFDYPGFSRDLKSHKDRLDEFDPLQDMYGVWFLKKNPYSKTQYVSSLFMMLPKDFNINSILDWTTLEEQQLQQFEHYCKAASRAAILVLGKWSGTRNEGQNNPADTTSIELLPDTTMDVLKSETGEELPTLTVDSELLTRIKQDAKQPLDTMQAIWAFTQQENGTIELQEVLFLNDPQAMDTVFKNIQNLFHDAEAAYLLRNFTMAETLYQKLIDLGCPSTMRKKIARRLQAIDMLRNGT